jgi:hypothetical protein
MHPVQLTSPNPALKRIGGHRELASGDDAVLTSREGGDLCIRAHFSAHTADE